MSAGRGVIHSEMPRQTDGRMRGFQLWINLPAKEKMKPAAYRDVPAAEIPTVTLEYGGSAKVIAGTLEQGAAITAGPIQGVSTAPLYFDVQLPPFGEFEAPLPRGHNAFLYVYEGQAAIGDQPLPNRAAGLLSDGDRVKLRTGQAGARLLLVAGKPLNEPVVQYGPFVMNTREEIERAVRDYQNGELTSA
jgi:redox-sensitive bicupin YhaK (pirin superfamily)